MITGDYFRASIRIFVLIIAISRIVGHRNDSSDCSEKKCSAGSLLDFTRLAKYQASIRVIVKDDVFGEGHICNGALIAPSVVLTVAHCLFDLDTNASYHPAELKVVLGSSQNEYQRTDQTLVYGVTHLQYRDTFDMENLRNDIAMVFLENDVPQEHPTIQPVELNLHVRKRSIDSFTRINATVEPRVDYVQMDGRLFEDGVLCTEIDQRTKRQCVEPGIPLVIAERLIGLTSYVSECGSKEDCRIVYTDVAYHSKWIRSTMGSGHNQNSSIWGWMGFALFTLWTLKLKLSLSRKYCYLSCRG